MPVVLAEDTAPLVVRLTRPVPPASMSIPAPAPPCTVPAVVTVIAPVPPLTTFRPVVTPVIEDPIPVVVTVYADRTFTFVTKTPPASVLLLKAAKVEKGSGTTGKAKVGAVTKKQVEEIAKLKLVDLNCTDLDAAVRTVEGTARSMGIDVKP